MLDAMKFAEEVLGSAGLGDRRLDRRAVINLAILSRRSWRSFVDACDGDAAAQEGLYRFIRNRRVSADVMIDAGCRATGQQVAQTCLGDILAVMDTTSFGYSHSVASELGSLGSGKDGRRRGVFCHLTVAVDAERGTVLGPLDIQYGVRGTQDGSEPRDHRALAYEEKESFKWEAAASAVDERNAPHRHRLIYVSDRESDVYEYLQYMHGHDLRFVVRASWDRRIDDPLHGRLRSALAAAPEQCHVSVFIEQRGGGQGRPARPARQALLAVRAVPVVLDGRKHGDEKLARIPLHVVQLTEVDPPAGADPIDWVLLTSEPVDTPEAAVRVARMYCMRWSIEEFNKVCKSDGTQAEKLRVQTWETLRCALTLLIFAAIPILRLRSSLQIQDNRRRFPTIVASLGDDASKVDDTMSSTSPTPPLQRGMADQALHVPHASEDASSPIDAEEPEVLCTSVLPDHVWKVLWWSVEKKKPLPSEAPPLTWALRAVARLGGWMDSKRSGRPGYPVLWRGWDRLLERVDAYEMALRHAVPTSVTPD